MKIFYPGTFDPITRGHLNVIKRASKIADELIVGVVYSPTHKNPYLTAEIRKQLIENSIKELDNVKVEFYDGKEGLYHAKEIGCQGVIRGIRSGKEFDIEQSHAQRLCEEQPIYSRIETIFIATCDKHGKTSSTTVRDLIVNNGNWKYLVPLATHELLEANLDSFKI